MPLISGDLSVRDDKIQCLLISSDAPLGAQVESLLPASAWLSHHATLDARAIRAQSQLSKLAIVDWTTVDRAEQVCRQLRFWSRPEPIVLLSLLPPNPSFQVSACFRAGCDDWCERDCLASLTSKLRMLLGLRRMMGGLRADLNAISRYQTEIEQVIAQRSAAIFAAGRVSPLSLSLAAEYGDDRVSEQVLRVRFATVILAEQYRHQDSLTAGDRLDHDFFGDLFAASGLHDLGMLGIDDLVRSSGPELEIGRAVQQHTLIGAVILEQAAAQAGEDRMLRMAAEIARFHHEWWNGTGYPHGLQGSQIPWVARIVAVAELADRLLQEHTLFRSAAAQREHVGKLLRQSAGKQLDPALVDVCIGSLARLQEINRRLETGQLTVTGAAALAGLAH